MSSAIEKKHIMVFTNPQRLRDLADKMEAVYAKAVAGDSNFVGTIAYDNSTNTFVDIHLDQSWFQSNE